MAPYRAAHEPDGDFVQYQSKALTVFTYQTRADGFRPEIAMLYGVDVDSLCCRLMGDLRHVRNDIIHGRGRISTRQDLPVISRFWKIRGDEWRFVDEDLRHLMD